MTNDNIPARAFQRWVARQPDHDRRHAATTAFFALRCIAAGWSSPATLEALADNVAKMQGRDEETLPAGPMVSMP